MKKIVLLSCFYFYSVWLKNSFINSKLFLSIIDASSDFINLNQKCKNKEKKYLEQILKTKKKMETSLKYQIFKSY